MLDIVQLGACLARLRELATASGGHVDVTLYSVDEATIDQLATLDHARQRLCTGRDTEWDEIRIRAGDASIVVVGRQRKRGS